MTVNVTLFQLNS